MFYVKVVYVRSIENHKIYLTNVVYSTYSAKEGFFFCIKNRVESDFTLCTWFWLSLLFHF